MILIEHSRRQKKKLRGKKYMIKLRDIRTTKVKFTLEEKKIEQKLNYPINTKHKAETNYKFLVRKRSS